MSKPFNSKWLWFYGAVLTFLTLCIITAYSFAKAGFTKSDRQILIGAIVILAAFGFAAWAFAKRNLTTDQRTILRWALPLASGIIVFAFTGTMSVKANGFWPGLAVTATGGFGVWLLTFFFLFPKSKPIATTVPATQPEEKSTKDVFICHVKEDEEAIVRPLAERIESIGPSVAYRTHSVKKGDSLSKSIAKGFEECRHGMIIQSSSFFAKGWPQAELDEVQRKTSDGKRPIFPVIRSLHKDDARQYIPDVVRLFEQVTGHPFDEVLEQFNTNSLDVTAEAFLDSIEKESRHKVIGNQVLTTTPKTARLHSGEWQSATLVVIANRSDKRVYSIALAIIPAKDIPTDSLSFDFDQTEKSPAGKIASKGGSITWNASVVATHCKYSNGRMFIVLHIHSIAAKGEFRFLISGTNPILSSAELVVCAFTNSPPEILAQGGKIAVPFVVPAVPASYFQ